MLSAGTDAKSFSRLGIRCFGFAPVRMPKDLDFMTMFHGVDERVPVSGLQFGVRVLDGLLDRCNPRPALHPISTPGPTTWLAQPCSSV